MFVRFASLVSLVAMAAGQQQLTPRRVPSPTRHAGVYHVATGTWTHAGRTAQFGADVIYNASRPSGYFGVGWEGNEGIDEGIIPSTQNPFGGPQDGYVVDGFEFGYCSQSGTIDWKLRFFDSYVPCDDPDDTNCTHQVGGFITIPNAPTAGACWTVTVDLSGGMELYMEAEGGVCAPGYQGEHTGLDHFGWGATWVTDDQAWAGPLLDGYDPWWAPPGEGTCYMPAQTCFDGATGLGAQDLFGIYGPGLSGCFFFGGFCSTKGCGKPIDCPAGQFRMILYTDCSAGFDPCARPDCVHEANQLGELALSDCSLAAGPLLQSTGLVGGVFAYHMIGQGEGIVVDPPGALGSLCLAGGAIGRYTADAGPVVAQAFTTDLIHGATGGGVGDLPWGGQLGPGQHWSFQTWVRVNGSSRFTPALRVRFEP